MISKRITAWASVALILLTAVTLMGVTETTAPTYVEGFPQRFNVDASDAGDNQVLAGVTGQRFLIKWMVVTSVGDADSFYLKSGSTELWYSASKPYTLDHSMITAPAGIEVSSPEGPFITDSGEDLTINLTAGEDFNVVGVYYVVK